MFDISESYSGAENKRKITICSALAPKKYTFELDLDPDKHPRIYETQLETFNRTRRFKKEKDLKLADFTRGATDN